MGVNEIAVPVVVGVLIPPAVVGLLTLGEFILEQIPDLMVLFFLVNGV